MPATNNMMLINNLFYSSSVVHEYFNNYLIFYLNIIYFLKINKKIIKNKYYINKL